MTEHHRMLLLLVEEAGTQVTAGYLAGKSGLNIGQVTRAGLELCHKKMLKSHGTLHIERDGHQLKTFVYRITGRGRSMCDRIRDAVQAGTTPP